MSQIDELSKSKNMQNLAPNLMRKKSNFISFDFVLLLVCCLGRFFLHKNPRDICVTICFGFTEKKSLVCLDYKPEISTLQEIFLRVFRPGPKTTEDCYRLETLGLCRRGIVPTI